MNILELIQENIASLDRSKIKYEEMRSLVAPYAEALDKLAEEQGADSVILTDQIVLSVPLKDFRDVMPLIEAVEELLHCNFDKTRDTDSYRVYTCSTTPWIRIDGEVPIDDGTDPTLKCRRVLTGKFQTYPEYKIVCTEQS